MDIRMQKQASPPLGSWTTVDTSSFHSMKLTCSYSHPMRLEWTVTAAQHSLPLDYTDFIRVWDDDVDSSSSGSGQGSGQPFFEGFIEEITPGSATNEVRIVAYDPTYRASKYVTVHQNGWHFPSASSSGSAAGGSFPVPKPSSYPRVVYNCLLDNDDDYAYSRSLYWTLGQIIEDILDTNYLPLYYLNAAPGSGSSGNGTPYDSSDTGGGSSSQTSVGSGSVIGGLHFKPQEKIVSQSESVRSLIERLLAQYDPATKLIWEPGDRKWRFRDLQEAPTTTITINDPDASHGPVLSMDIQRTAEGRFAAVEFNGPENIVWAVARWTNPNVSSTSSGTSSSDAGTPGTLSVIDTSTVGSSGEGGTCYSKLQITDSNFAGVVRKGPYPVMVPGPYAVQRDGNGEIVTKIAQTYVQTWGPAVLAKWKSSAGGDSEWHTITGWRLDARNGIFDFGGACIFRWNAQGAAGEKFEEPDEIVVYYPTFGNKLWARYPFPGFGGTINTVAGLENVRREYDESLAVSYVYGQPVTTATRVSRFITLAQQIHRQTKDLIYSGGLVLEGINWDFRLLNRRVNIAAKDDDGSTLTTGWESVGAWVTDVEYDFEEQTTTLQFSSDQMELVGMDPELLKTRLNIRAAQLQVFFSSSVAITYPRSGSDWRQQVTYTFGGGAGFFDEFGGVQ